MSASRESASSDRAQTSPNDGPVLVCGLNWLGDSIMSMPAICALKRSHPDVSLVMLVKQKLVDLWRMQPRIDEVLELNEGLAGTLGTARSIRRRAFERVYIMPHSFRSALVPFLAGIPQRIGMPGHCRDWMLTHTVESRVRDGREHQSFEYMDLLGTDEVDSDLKGLLEIPSDELAAARQRIDTSIPECSHKRLVALFPGAAFGPAKRWPVDRFKEVARRLVEEDDRGIIVAGTSAEAEAGASIAGAAGKGVLDVTGKTTVPELAALLSHCEVAVANDSGGMHLAAAVGVKVVAIYGITDPVKTGPMGEGHRLVIAEGVEGSRDIGRDSGTARAALESIDTDSVYRAAKELIS